MLAVVVIAPLWMLLAKPLILYNRHLEIVRQKESQGGEFELTEQPSPKKARNDEDEERLIGGGDINDEPQIEEVRKNTFDEELLLKL